MRPVIYDLPLGDAEINRSVSRWLILALLSLVAAGLFSVLLVLARTPVIQAWIPFVDFFHVALVVHVNLSVLVWLLAITAAMWSVGSSGEHRHWDALSYWLSVTGTVVKVVEAFSGQTDPPNPSLTIFSILLQ